MRGCTGVSVIVAVISEGIEEDDVLVLTVVIGKESEEETIALVLVTMRSSCCKCSTGGYISLCLLTYCYYFIKCINNA